MDIIYQALVALACLSIFSTCERLGRSTSDVEQEDKQERQVYTVPRVGREASDFLEDLALARRNPILPRLGTFLEEYRRYLSPDDDVRQVTYVPRTGRYRREAGEERAAPLPRLGYLFKKYLERAAPLPRLGMRQVIRAPLPRLGYRDEEEAYDTSRGGRTVPLPRLGARENHVEVEDMMRAAPLPRLGMRDFDLDRDTRLPRLGVRDVDHEDEKRAMGMLGMGGKREIDEEHEKRSMVLA